MQFIGLKRRRHHGNDLQYNAGILLGKAFDNGRENRCRDRFGTSDPDGADRWIGQKLDCPNRLFQLAEGGTASFNQFTTIDRQFDAASAPVDEWYLDRLLETCNDLRYGRLGYAKLPRGLGNAAVLSDRQEKVQVAQL